MARREATAEQTTAEQLAQQQKRVQRVQQKNAAITAGEEWVDEWEVAGYFSEEGYYSGSNSDCSSGDREAEVAATAMREWDRQHGWLHSPAERAADRSEAEQELAKVVARWWQR